MLWEVEIFRFFCVVFGNQCQCIVDFEQYVTNTTMMEPVCIFERRAETFGIICTNLTLS